jgi:MFS family permease
MANPDPHPLDQMILEEYKSLRAEILQCLDKRVGIISLGLAAIGALCGGGVSALGGDHPKWLAAAIIIGFGVPVTSLYVLDVWFSEWRRLVRASWHNWYLELKLQQQFPGQVAPLEWEQRVRSGGPPYQELKAPFETTTWVFVGFATLSGLSGLYLLLRAAEESQFLSQGTLWSWWIPMAIVLTIAGLSHLIWRLRQTKKLATDYSTKPNLPG